MAVRVDFALVTSVHMVMSSMIPGMVMGVCERIA